MGFEPEWRDWIKRVCLICYLLHYNQWFSDGLFPAKRGSRQEDPLSPFLFVIIGESKSDAFSCRRISTLIRGFKPSSNAPSISHLHFADYALFFCNAEDDQVKNMVAILRCFEAAYDFTINLSTSAILGVSNDDIPLCHFANIMGFKVDSFPPLTLVCPVPW